MARRRGTVGAGVLLGLLVLAVAGRADEDEVVKAIKKEGGRVRVDAKQPGKPVVWVDFRGTRIADAELKILKELKEPKSLQWLLLDDTDITDAGLKELKEFKSLLDLSLRDTVCLPTKKCSAVPTKKYSAPVTVYAGAATLTTT